jgi:DNA polymerase elongation subunit (family B)
MKILEKDAKVLLFDIETSPMLSYTWGMWEQDVIEVEKTWYILSFAAKWLGGKKTEVYGLCDFKGYRSDKSDDRHLVEKLHKLLEEADYVIAHNGDVFDLKKANARFIFHRIPPTKPYVSIDTLKIARRYFKFESNKLDDLGQYLGVGRKLPHTGKHLWFGCMKGDMKSWRKMKAYNVQDVLLLEQVYLAMRGWSKNHPNLNVVSRKVNACPKCQSTNIQKRGFVLTRTSEAQRYQCRDCLGWCSGAPEKLASKVLTR